MAQIPAADRPRKFIPSLEGVRGYAFIVVFFNHYLTGPLEDVHRWWLFPAKFLIDATFVFMPVFFVLSGFLICGILIDSREKQGYFKVFYSHRILRVFPPYYLTLLGVSLFCALNGYSLGHRFWAHFLYIHNLFPSYFSTATLIPNCFVFHLWSMGVEEQFYLLWPLVVWVCPNRRVLLNVTLVFIACSFALRFAAPQLGIDQRVAYFWTPTMVDAILLGAVLAIIRRDPIYRRIERFAGYVALAGLGLSALIGSVLGLDPARIAPFAPLLIPLYNLTAAGVVVSVMREGSWPCRICSTRGICWMGARSYSLYLFHFTYLSWFLGTLVPRLVRHMPHSLAIIVAVATAFALTVLLAALCYRFIEQPAMNMKKRIKYGSPRMSDPAWAAARPAILESD